MNDPLFKVGQRVYNRANPYHGKVLEILRFGSDTEWSYLVKLDQPNPSRESTHIYMEGGLRATLEEAIEWRKNESYGWFCPFCIAENEPGSRSCFKCAHPWTSSCEG